MTTQRFFECQKCGRIHYGVKLEDADKLNGSLSGEFNERSHKHCSNCGSSYPFVEVSEDYVTKYADGNELEPWLYPKDADEPTTVETNQP